MASNQTTCRRGLVTSPNPLWACPKEKHRRRARGQGEDREEGKGQRFGSPYLESVNPGDCSKLPLRLASAQKIGPKCCASGAKTLGHVGRRIRQTPPVNQSRCPVLIRTVPKMTGRPKRRLVILLRGAGSVASKAQVFRAADRAELHSESSARDQSYCAHRIAPLLSTMICMGAIVACAPHGKLREGTGNLFLKEIRTVAPC
jgi:hypothetical protein